MRTPIALILKRLTELEARVERLEKGAARMAKYLGVTHVLND